MSTPTQDAYAGQPSTPPAQSSDALPLTGFDVITMVVLAASLVGLGIVTRVKARTQ